MKIILFAGLLGTFSLNTNAEFEARTWVDRDPFADILNFYGDTVSGRLSILAPDADSFVETAGFNPLTDTLSGARIGWHFDGVPRDVDWPIAGWRLNAFTTVSTTWEVIPGVPVEFKAWGPLATQGFMDFTLTYKGQSTTPVTLTYANLSATGEAYIEPEPEVALRSVSVPDGGSTALLAGASIAAMAVISRRRGNRE